jgi:hypothetical protein
MTTRFNICCDCKGILWTASITSLDEVPEPFHVLTMTCQDCKGDVDYIIRELPEGRMLGGGNA